MAQPPAPSPAPAPAVKRIGIISAMEDDAALRFLILRLDLVPTGFEFEFVLFEPGDPFLATLARRRPVDRDVVRRECAAFHDRHVARCTPPSPTTSRVSRLPTTSSP